MLVVATLVGLTFAIETPGSGIYITLPALVLVVTNQLVLGYRARQDPGSRTATVYAVILIASVGIAVVGNTTASVLLMFACPMLWFVTKTDRGAVLANLVLALVVIATSWANDDLFSGFIIGSLSFILSMTLGSWVSHEERNTAEMADLVAQLRSSQASVAELEHQAGRDAERERVALDIHDTIAQSLTGLVMTAQRSRRELAPDQSATAADLDLIINQATNALGEARALAAEYSAPNADGIGEALRRLVDSFQRETGVTVELIDDVPGGLPREQEVVLLRCAQESLANVRKHAKADRVELRLTRAEGPLTLTVRDDGVGLTGSTTAPGEGTGISGMTRRVELAGGTLSVADVVPRGVEVRVELP